MGYLEAKDELLTIYEMTHVNVINEYMTSDEVVESDENISISSVSGFLVEQWYKKLGVAACDYLAMPHDSAYISMVVRVVFGLTLQQILRASEQSEGDYISLKKTLKNSLDLAIERQILSETN